MTVRDVAARAGVALSTVSNAVNHPERLAASTLERVNAAIAELGFIRNDAARQLRLGSSNVFGMVVIDATSPYYAELDRSVENEAERHGYAVLLGNSGQDPARQSKRIVLFEAQRMRGLLVAPVSRDLDQLAEVVGRGLPVTLIDYVDPQGRFPSVAVDHVRGGELAAAHLTQSGCTRIGLVQGPVDFPQIVERMTGAESAIQAAGATSIDLRATALTFEGGLLLGRELCAMDAASRPDGVFAATDQVAMGVVHAIVTDAHLRVPEDIAVVGYDDIEYAEGALVPLTTVRQPIATLGHEAVQLLLRQIEGDTRPTVKIFEPELVVRASAPAQRPTATGRA
ncbi:LacI family DNA-binding transcriptional regulator [Gulosibacter sp. ACHW.36C]|uniref:LacI family transcriptional regulator n=1 Tax=Gulosibacter sediminis TaxID=1729695 RepID=A0ABY4MV34_9MICO|nr:LacI family DNA-binding transcriptional regulator [Gulosibacter sediminis]UQN14244.1 LacI family transcriptional regulator [Gulosibacter sediminis]